MLTIVQTPQGPKSIVRSMLTDQDRTWLAALRSEPARHDDRNTVRECFALVSETLRQSGVYPAMDDRAEALTAALYRYIVESRMP